MGYGARQSRTVTEDEGSFVKRTLSESTREVPAGLSTVGSSLPSLRSCAVRRSRRALLHVTGRLVLRCHSGDWVTGNATGWPSLDWVTGRNSLRAAGDLSVVSLIATPDLRAPPLRGHLRVQGELLAGAGEREPAHRAPGERDAARGHGRRPAGHLPRGGACRLFSCSRTSVPMGDVFRSSRGS